MPTPSQIHTIFTSLEQNPSQFFHHHLADDLDWEIKGTFCPISRHYTSKSDFLALAKTLDASFASPLNLQVQNILCDGAQAAVELRAVDTRCRNGMPYENEYTWVCEFDGAGRIVRVRAYMDTDLVCRVLRENQECGSLSYIRDSLYKWLAGDSAEEDM